MATFVTGSHCQVLTADLGWLRPEHHEVLDRAERVQADRFVHGADRFRFVLGAVVARLALAAQLSARPDEVVIDRTCCHCGGWHGKPRIPEGRLHFSVSHSASMVLVALTAVGPVGVDVEHRGRRRPTTLARHVLAESEPLTKEGDFFTYWCRKESAVKATGDGLRAPLRTVVVSPADAPARLIRYRGIALPSKMADLDLGKDFAGSVTVLTAADITLELISTAPLLAQFRSNE